MSERRTADIKFRCTPTFKSGLQAAADAAGQTVTEYVEAAVWAQQNAKLEPAVPVESLLDEDDLAVLQDDREPTDFYGGPDFDAAGVADIAVPVAAPEADVAKAKPGLLEFISTNVRESGALTSEALEAANRQVLNEKPQLADALEAQAATAPTCNCRAWEFCTHKAKA